MNIRTLFKISILAAFIFAFQSCGDDDITGCTDPDAENFNADANVSGDCVYARDKFLGTYIGVFTCPGDLAGLSNDSISFSIIEGLDPDVTSDIILELIVDGFPLAIAGTVDGDVLILMQELNGVPVPTPLGEFPGDVTAVGMATVTDDDQSLTATLDLDVLVESPLGNLPVADMCGIIGSKE